MARWLLLAQDRREADEIALMHEFLSLMFGVRGAGVTTALRHLGDKALMATARGTMAIRDRSARHGEPPRTRTVIASRGCNPGT